MQRRRSPVVLLVALLGAFLAAGPAALAPAATAEPTAGPLRSSGAPITGAVSRVNATAMAEGVWLDTLGGVGGARQTLYYTVHRQRTDSTLHVSATTPLGPESDQIGITLLDPEGRTCGSDTDSGYGGSDGMPLIAVSVGIPRTRDAADTHCAAAGDFVVQVDHGYSGSSASGRRDPVPVELRVREEPPVTSLDALPATVATPTWRDPDLTAKATPIAGGTALNAARVLAPGTYTSAITTGDSQVFAVQLDDGQSLVAAARIKVPATLAQQLSTGGSPTLSVRLLSPSRVDAAGGNDYESTATDHQRGTGSVSSSADGRVVYEYTDTVNYRARYASASEAQGASERGRYLVVVSLLDRSGDARSVTVPFVLGLAVRGSVAHVPDYAVSDDTTVDDAQAGAGGPVDLVRRVAGIAAIGVGALAVLGGAVLLVVATRRRIRSS